MSSDQSTSRECEHCGARTDSGSCWNRPSGTPGYVSRYVDQVQRADFALGHEGYLCTRCWWATRMAA